MRSTVLDDDVEEFEGHGLRGALKNEVEKVALERVSRSLKNKLRTSRRV